MLPELLYDNVSDEVVEPLTEDDVVWESLTVAEFERLSEIEKLMDDVREFDWVADVVELMDWVPDIELEVVIDADNDSDADAEEVADALLEEDAVEEDVKLVETLPDCVEVADNDLLDVNDAEALFELVTDAEPLHETLPVAEELFERDDDGVHRCVAVAV